MTYEKMLDKFEELVRNLVLDEGMEYADPNRENSETSAKEVKDMKDKILKIMCRGGGNG